MVYGQEGSGQEEGSEAIAEARAGGVSYPDTAHQSAGGVVMRSRSGVE